MKHFVTQQRVAGLEPGDEISALEGLDLEGETAVVVEIESNGDDTSTLTLLFPDLGATSQVTVSDESLTSVEPREHGKAIPVDVVDTLRSTSPNRVVPVIRDNVPDSFFPPDPNGTESDLTTTLWRPTVRRTPYLNVLQASHRRRLAEDEVEKIPTSTFPATMPPEADQHRPRSSTRLDDRYSDGSPRRPRQYNRPYEVRYDRSQHPVVDLDQTMLPSDGWSEEEEQHLAELADLFWTSYKEAQLTALPSRPGLGHSGLHLDDWAIIWQQETPISVEEMDELWHYLIAARMASATAYRAWRDKLRGNMLNPIRTPGYTSSKRYPPAAAAARGEDDPDTEEDDSLVREVEPAEPREAAHRCADTDIKRHGRITLSAEAEDAGPYYLGNPFEYWVSFGTKASAVPGSPAQRKAFDLALTTFNVASLLLEPSAPWPEVRQVVKIVAKTARALYHGEGGAGFERTVLKAASSRVQSL